MSAEFCR